MDERESLISFVITRQVLDAKQFNELYLMNPFVADLLINQFKQFLSDDYFTKFERQNVLVSFLMNQKNVEILRDVVSFCSTCELKADYDKIILEWNYNVSEAIKDANLFIYDGEELGKSRLEFSHPQKVKKSVIPEDFLDMIIEKSSEYLKDTGIDPPIDFNDGDDNDDE